MKRWIENFWFYYKWYVAAGVILMVVIGNFAYEKTHTQNPDHIVAVVVSDYVTEDEQRRLTASLEAVMDDKDEDGEVEVAVYVYPYDGAAMEAQDKDAFMAAAVQLAADIQTQTSELYITNVPELLMEADAALIKNDSVMLEESVRDSGVACLEQCVILRRQGMEEKNGGI